jgi:4-hydroxybenzoate polyprenyltransferase
LPLALARFAAFVIPLATLLFAFWWDAPTANNPSNFSIGYVLLAYLLIQIAYSFYLKNIVIIDVLTVTSGFVLRVIAGVAVINVENFSPWLYACAGLLALFLAVGKRRQELVELGDAALNTRPIFKDYNLALIDDMLRLVTTSTFIAYLLYTIEAETGTFGGIKLSLITVPIVLYGLFRYLYLIHVRGEGSAPDEVLLTDRPLQAVVVVWGLTWMILLYFLGR